MKMNMVEFQGITSTQHITNGHQASIDERCLQYHSYTGKKALKHPLYTFEMCFPLLKLWTLLAVFFSCSV